MGTTEPTITLAVRGDIDIDTFAAAVKGLRELARALASDLTPQTQVDWELENLGVGSAVITLRAVSESEAASRAVTRAYDEIGATIAADEPLQYSEKISHCARKLARLTRRKRVRSVEFATESRAHNVTALRTNASVPIRQTESIGSVTGRIETLSRRGDLHLTLLDDVFNNRVALHLKAGQEEVGRSAWDQHVTVSGVVSQDPGSGRPTDIHEITSIEPVREYARGAWRAARGAIPWKPGDPPAELTIREIRGRA